MLPTPIMERNCRDFSRRPQKRNVFGSGNLADAKNKAVSPVGNISNGKNETVSVVGKKVFRSSAL